MDTDELVQIFDHGRPIVDMWVDDEWNRLQVDWNQPEPEWVYNELAAEHELGETECGK